MFLKTERRVQLFFLTLWLLAARAGNSVVPLIDAHTSLSHNLAAMTDEEALQEAERRWPEDGAIQRWNHPLPKKPCLVGRRIRGVFHILGEGTPGKEAFEAAEGRQ